MKYITKYQRPILAFTLLWVVYNDYFSSDKNKDAALYLSVSVYTTMFFLLILAYERTKKIPVMKMLLPLAFLTTTFQLIGLIKIYETPPSLADLIPPLFSMVTSIIAITINCIVFGVFEWLVRKENYYD